MGIESGRSPGVPDRNGETSALGGCSDEKALSHSSCRIGGTLRTVIVVVEGPSAAGKTSWIFQHCDPAMIVGETAPATASAAPDAQREPLAASEFWTVQNACRWREALRLEITHGVAICDSDPFKLHYTWSLWRTGHASLTYWRTARDASRRSFIEGKVGLADLYLVSIPDSETLFSRRQSDHIRRRHNFDLHLELVGPLSEWYQAVEEINPHRVIWHLPPEGVPSETTRREPRSGDDLFDALLSYLPAK